MGKRKTRPGPAERSSGTSSDDCKLPSSSSRVLRSVRANKERRQTKRQKKGIEIKRCSKRPKNENENDSGEEPIFAKPAQAKTRKMTKHSVADDPMEGEPVSDSSSLTSSAGYESDASSKCSAISNPRTLLGKRKKKLKKAEQLKRAREIRNANVGKSMQEEAPAHASQELGSLCESSMPALHDVPKTSGVSGDTVLDNPEKVQLSTESSASVSICGVESDGSSTKSSKAASALHAKLQKRLKKLIHQQNLSRARAAKQEKQMNCISSKGSVQMTVEEVGQQFRYSGVVVVDNTDSHTNDSSGSCSTSETASRRSERISKKVMKDSAGRGVETILYVAKCFKCGNLRNLCHCLRHRRNNIGNESINSPPATWADSSSCGSCSEGTLKGKVMNAGSRARKLRVTGGPVEATSISPQKLIGSINTMNESQSREPPVNEVCLGQNDSSAETAQSARTDFDRTEKDNDSQGESKTRSHLPLYDLRNVRKPLPNSLYVLPSPLIAPGNLRTISRNPNVPMEIQSPETNEVSSDAEIIVCDKETDQSVPPDVQENNVMLPPNDTELDKECTVPDVHQGQPVGFDDNSTTSSSAGENFEYSDEGEPPSDLESSGSEYLPSTSDDEDEAVGLYNSKYAPPPNYFNSLQKRRWEKAAREGILFAAKGQIDTRVAKYCHAGAFTVTCANPRCKAVFFELEAKYLPQRNGMFEMCCKAGRVVMPEIKDPPPDLAELFDGAHPLSKTFMRMIDEYNESEALCGTASKILGYEKAFPYCYRIQGSIYTPISPAYANLMHNPNNPNNPVPMNPWNYVRRNNQCRFVDTDQAVAHMLKAKPKLCKDVLMLLEHVLRSVNPWFKSYMTMGETWRHHFVDAHVAGLQQPSDLIMIFRRADDLLTVTKPNGEVLEPLNRTEVCGIYEQGAVPSEPTMVVRMYGRPYSMPLHSQFIFAFKYPLLFPYGEILWHCGMKHAPEYQRGKRNRTTLRSMVRCYLMRRNPLKAIHKAGRLAQKFVVHADVRIDDRNLQYLKNHQHKLRTVRQDLLQRYVNIQAPLHNAVPGRVFVLPANYARSQHAYDGYLRDQLAIVQKYGKYDLFVTITCNRNSPEFKEFRHLIPESDSGNLDMIHRLFDLKLKRFLDLMINQYCFGEVVHYVYTIEFQNRGGVHAHMLITLKNKIVTPDDVDQYIQAVIPPKDSVLFRPVTEYMIHERCSPKCFKPGVVGCAKGFPAPYSETTVMQNGSHRVLYKRPDDGYKVIVKGVVRTHRTVAPYNPFMLLYFDSHVCVEAVRTIDTIYYLLGYIFKGPGKATVRVWEQKVAGFVPPERCHAFPNATELKRRSDLHNVNYFIRTDKPEVEPNTERQDEVLAGNSRYLDYDEIAGLSEMRIRTASESNWAIFFNKFYKSFISVQHLPVHVEGQKTIAVHNEDFVAALQREPKDSKLEAFFTINQVHGSPTRELLYEELTDTHYYHAVSGSWKKRRKRINRTVSRVVEINPQRGDVFYLRMLLKVRRGPTSYEDLRTVNGEELPTYKEAARRLGLLREDDQYYKCLDEAFALRNVAGMRNLLVLVFMVCELLDPEHMFDHYVKQLTSDWVHLGMNQVDATQKLRRYIARRLIAAGSTHMPQYTEEINVDVDEEHAYHTDDEPRVREDPPLNNDELQEKYTRLNDEQRRVADIVLSKERDYVSGSIRKDRTVFLEGPAGTGKSTVIMYLYEAVRAANGRVVRMAPTGMAANNIGGRTAHSVLQLPLNMTAESVSSLEPSKIQYHTLRQATLIIFDELAMASSHYFRIMHEKLCEIHDVPETGPIFAGVPVLLGGDFRQAGPIATGGFSMAQLHLRNWEKFKKVELQSLTRNMRAAEDPHFAEFLRQVGEGSTPKLAVGGPNSIRLQNSWIVRSMDKLIDKVFGVDMSKLEPGRCIVAMRNPIVNWINSLVLERMEGTIIEYNSEDVFLDDSFTPENPSVDTRNDDPMVYVHPVSEWLRGQLSIDYLNMLTPPGMPPHALRLKIGCMLMLIRNLDVDRGLVNGTRLRLDRCSENLLQCMIVSGVSFGKMVYIPRIDIMADASRNVHFRRNQFPVRLSFAATILKMQGQTLDFVGIFLERHLFNHGLLCVALSRVRNSKSLAILLNADSHQGVSKNIYFTENTVNHQIWNLSQEQITSMAPVPTFVGSYEPDVTEEDESLTEDLLDQNVDGIGTDVADGESVLTRDDLNVFPMSGHTKQEARRLAYKRLAKETLSEEEALIADFYISVYRYEIRGKNADVVAPQDIPLQSDNLDVSSKQCSTDMQRLLNLTIDGSSWRKKYSEPERLKLADYLARDAVVCDDYMWRLASLSLDNREWRDVYSNDTAALLRLHMSKFPTFRTRYNEARKEVALALANVTGEAAHVTFEVSKAVDSHQSADRESQWEEELEIRQLMSHTVDGTSWLEAYTESQRIRLTSYFSSHPAVLDDYMWDLATLSAGSQNWNELYAPDVAQLLKNHLHTHPEFRAQFESVQAEAIRSQCETKKTDKMKSLANRTKDGSSWRKKYSDSERSEFSTYLQKTPDFARTYRNQIASISESAQDWTTCYPADTVMRMKVWMSVYPDFKEIFDKRVSIPALETREALDEIIYVPDMTCCPVRRQLQLPEPDPVDWMLAYMTAYNEVRILVHKTQAGESWNAYTTCERNTVQQFFNDNIYSADIYKRQVAEQARWTWNWEALYPPDVVRRMKFWLQNDESFQKWFEEERTPLNPSLHQLSSREEDFEDYTTDPSTWF